MLTIVFCTFLHGLMIYAIQSLLLFLNHDSIQVFSLNADNRCLWIILESRITFNPIQQDRIQSSPHDSLWLYCTVELSHPVTSHEAVNVLNCCHGILATKSEASNITANRPILLLGHSGASKSGNDCRFRSHTIR